jgi:hypothetical protein
LFGFFSLFAFGIFLFGCSNDGDGGDTSGDGASISESEAAVERTVRSAADAYNQRNLNAFLSFWTDDGLIDEFGATRTELAAAGGGPILEGPPLTLRDISDTKVSGSKATTEVEFVFGKQLAPTRYELVLENGAWKIDGTQDMAASIPSGTNTVDVDLDEFSFVYNEQISNGKLAFKADNVGELLHEMVLLKVPASFNLQSLLTPSDELPAGVDVVGFLGPLEPDDNANMVFTEDLASGRYVMVCFLPDESDPAETPHVARGMAREFSVPAQGGN